MEERNNAKLADALREAAALLEKMPDNPTWQGSLFTGHYGDDAKSILADHVRSFGPWDKKYMGETFYIEKTFSPLFKLQLFAHRTAVCKQVVTEEDVPAHVIPAQPEQVVPATTRKKVEWVCNEPLLGPSADDGPDFSDGPATYADKHG